MFDFDPKGQASPTEPRGLHYLPAGRATATQGKAPARCNGLGAACGGDLPEQAGGQGLLDQAVEEKIGRSLKGGEQSQKRRQANLPNPALDARYLDRGEARLMSQFFLRPALRLPRCPDVGAEALDRSIHELDRLCG